MSGPVFWDWSDNRRQRKLTTVRDCILWSYAMLSVSRRAMKDLKAGKPYPYPQGRLKAANIEMTRYQRGQRNITSLDRDDRLAQDAFKICAHCGVVAEAYHWDHLIPQMRLVGEHLPLNQVRSCIPCNTGRGAKDLMEWHRVNKTFPSLAVLRRYLKLCYAYAERHDFLDQPLAEAMQQGLPFNPGEFPRRFPPVELLV